jgi:excisionase family DNA binding protein
MGQLIDFADSNLIEQIKELDVQSNEQDSITVSVKYKLTLTILVHNHPGKECFSLKEAAEKIGVGEEFIRRRIKSGKIKATYLGDKPFINIVELARIITKGV